MFIKLLYCVTCALWAVPVRTSLPPELRLGFIFDEDDPYKEVAFRQAIDGIERSKVFSFSHLIGLRKNVTGGDSFRCMKSACELIQEGVSAIIGPSHPQSALHVQSLCDNMNIPHIEVLKDFRLFRGNEFSVNLYPHPSSLATAYSQLVKALKWRSFAVLYDDNEGLIRMQEILKLMSPDDDMSISVQQLPPHGDYGPLLKLLKKNGETKIVVDCPIDKIRNFLNHAVRIKMVTTYHSYLFTNLDSHMINLEDFLFADTNLTTFRIIDPENKEVASVVSDWVFGEQRHGRMLDLNENTLKTDQAVLYDAVQVYAKAMEEFGRKHHIQMDSLSCRVENSWRYGKYLMNFIKLTEFQGITGKIKFDQFGFRTNFKLDIVKYSKEGPKKMGEWDLDNGINFTRTYGEIYEENIKSLVNKTLIVTTAASAPYIFVVENNVTKAPKFEGYAVDLIDEISKHLGFNYTFKLVDDGKYGVRNSETGEWNGMIRELLDQRADLAIVDLTITYEREQAVDFTTPFMNLGISILYKKPIPADPSLFSFLSPLSPVVWIYMMTAYLGVSILMFILARITPYEWDNPHPCIEEPEVLENTFNLLNSMWFTIGSLMQQGSDIAPKALSTRMIAGMWWFFTLIMISSYTANLTAFLTVSRMDSPITSAEDLAKQTKIKYGCLGSGSTTAFFRNSKIPTYQRMWSFMESTTPSVFSKSNAEGVERVSKDSGAYAYLMESTSIEYIVERKCDLEQIGSLLDSKGYGIALPPDSPYLGPISSTILKLQEENMLYILKTRWWKEKGGNVCEEVESAPSSAAAELGMSEVGGVFVVLLFGMVISCLMAIIEFLWKSRKLAIQERASLCTEMGKELRFVLRCQGTKPVKKDPYTFEEEEEEDDDDDTSQNEQTGNGENPYG